MGRLTERRDDRRVYTTEAMYTIEKTLADDKYLCRKLKYAAYSSEHWGLELPWHLVGIYLYQGEGEFHVIDRVQIVGKLLHTAAPIGSRDNVQLLVKLPRLWLVQHR